jgi:hypothetical protein
VIVQKFRSKKDHSKVAYVLVAQEVGEEYLIQHLIEAVDHLKPQTRMDIKTFLKTKLGDYTALA